MTAFLPLASNAGWLERGRLLELLGLRLKALLLLEERLLVDDGAYHFTIDGKGASEQAIPPTSCTWDRADMQKLTAPPPPGASLSLRIDFLPLFRAAGLEKAPGIEWVEQQLHPHIRRGLKADVEKIRADPRVIAAAPIEPAARDAWVKCWIHDSFLAQHLRASLAVDALAGPFVDSINRTIVRRSVPLGAGMIVLSRLAVAFALPDLTGWSWETLLTFRASAQGKQLRERVAAIREALSAKAATLEAEQEIAYAVSADDQRSIDELFGFQGGAAHVTQVICALNFAPIPGMGLSGTVSDVARELRGTQAWVYVIGRNG